MLADAVTHDRFLLAESVELTVSPWEWRQWALTPSADPQLPRRFDNPPLFQTIDPNLVNPAGPIRSTFLAFVDANAEGLAARTVEVPAMFRSPSQRVPPGSKPLAIDVPAATLASYPTLSADLGAIGCPQCHTANADFQQVSAARVFSAFTALELAARTARLDVMTSGVAVPTPSFGPLQ